MQNRFLSVSIWSVYSGGGGGEGYSPNMVNGGVPLKWVTFFQETPKHGVWFCAGKSLNMPPTFVILL